jgi:acyl dehydratase
VRAFNTATESENKIHDDEVARRFGFRGGLVPGVDVYAYLCHLPAEHWGRPWLERGTMSARFASPVYDGDEVDVRATAEGDGLDLLLEDRATGRATLPAGAPPLPDPGGWPSGPPPSDPPPVSREALLGAPFGSLSATFRADKASAYLDDIREDLALFRVEAVAHPGWLLRFANWVLAANVRLGPWIHVASEVQFFGTVQSGDVVETRALVTDEHERKGHRFVVLDVLQVVGERPVTRTTHTAIHTPRGAVG